MKLESEDKDSGLFSTWGKNSKLFYRVRKYQSMACLASGLEVQPYSVLAGDQCVSQFVCL